MLEYIASRYKVAYGGRGSTKSWGFASVLVMLMTMIDGLRVLCARELQNSIEESVHALLAERIEDMGYGAKFEVQNSVIYGPAGSTGTRGEIHFAGVKSDPGKIKSAHGYHILFIEEAEKISKASWRVLPATIRETGSEIWVVFNPRLENDETYKRLVVNLPPKCRRVKINWSDNPWWNEELELERKYSVQLINNAKDDDERAQAQAEYDHIWEGFCQKNTEAAVFRRRIVIEDFPDPVESGDQIIKYGADWGFSVDPTCLIRFWITGDLNDKREQELWISHEAYGYRTEMDLIPELFDKVPGSRRWPIKGDCSRPETISYVGRQGFGITAAEKWPGSVEDGVEHIRAFKKIHIHTRCRKMQEEARMYSFKVDRVSGDVLPVILDAYNHGWDAIRYGLDGYIQRRGVDAQWRLLSGE